MKKFLILFIFCFMLMPRVCADSYAQILDKETNKYGVLNSQKEDGIIYAAFARLDIEKNKDSLLIVRYDRDEKSLICEIWDENSCQSLITPFHESAHISLVWNGAFHALKRDIGQADAFATEYFILQNGSVAHAKDFIPIQQHDIAALSFGRLNCFANCGADNSRFYSFMSAAKQNEAGSYILENKLYSMSTEKLRDIRTFLGACSGLESFDIHSINYDKWFLSLLKNHESFRYLTALEPSYHTNGEDGKIEMVSGEYISYIANSAFGISPRRPSSLNLQTKGYCFRNGEYLYTEGGSESRFVINRVDSVFDIGGGVYYVLFSDTRIEENISKNEYSFAIIYEHSGEPLKLLRIEMGGVPLRNDELLTYSPFDENNSRFIRPAPSFEREAGGFKKGIFIFLPVFLAAVLAVCAAVRYIINKR